MAQGVEIVTAALTATGDGTTDFTVSGFGTPVAAIVIVGNANSTNNPQSDAAVSIGFYDGTTQYANAAFSSDALGTSATSRVAKVGYAAVVPTSSGWAAGYQASFITDGLRLTLPASVDSTTLTRYATVVLLKGVSAKVTRVTTHSTLNGTATSSSLGFAPAAAICATTGLGSDTAGTTTQAHNILTFGVATSDGTHRMIGWGSANYSAAGDLNAYFSESYCSGQTFSASQAWAGEITTWGADTLTVTTRVGGSIGDVIDMLVLGGADLSLLLGTITTATSTGSADVTTTGIDPEVVLACLSNLSSAGSVSTTATASGFAIGLSDGATHAGYAHVDEDAADTTNAESKYSSSNAIYSRTSASGTASDLIAGSVSMGAEKFSVNYTTVSGTARKGWFLAFGPAASSGLPTLTALTASNITTSGWRATLTAA